MSDPTLPALRSLGNEPPSADLVRDLRRTADLPRAALDTFWSVLGPCLSSPVPRHMGAALDAFASEHGLPADDTVARAVRACRTRVRGDQVVGSSHEVRFAVAVVTLRCRDRQP
jgi:hypothetical protein